MDEFIVSEEFLTEISDLINQNEIKFLSKKMDIYDIANMYLENNQSEDPFFIVNVGDIIRQYKKWEYFLPRIRPFFAIKCNPDELILKILARLGCGFDCASKNEISKIISFSIDPQNIIYANPCKMVSQIKFARAHDVDLLVFDSEHELYKIKLYHSDAKLVLRIKTNDKDSVCRFSCKFGADLEEIENILKIAKHLELNVCGVAFHVGSNCMNSDTYHDSIKNSRQVFEISKLLGFEMNLLDIGGGFPGIDSDKVTFEKIAKTINDALDEYFSDIKDLKIIAEPGRFFVSSSHNLLINIINKKVKISQENGDKRIIFYINESVYSSLNNIIMDHFIINESNFLPFNERNEKKYKCTIFGPTCDSMDKVTDEILLPDLEIGEYIIVKNMGAYTSAVNSGVESFNGFNRAISRYVLN